MKVDSFHRSNDKDPIEWLEVFERAIAEESVSTTSLSTSSQPLNDDTDGKLSSKKSNNKSIKRTTRKSHHFRNCWQAKNQDEAITKARKAKAGEYYKLTQGPSDETQHWSARDGKNEGTIGQGSHEKMGPKSPEGISPALDIV
ncbi:11374_t:CDS:2, partial [Gigaspora margarita]